MIFNSIRGRLQLWYGLLLVAVLAGFGFTAYQLERNRQMRNVDDELQRHLAVLSRSLEHNGPKNEGRDGHFPGHPLPPDDPLNDGPPEGEFQPGFPAPTSFKLPAFATNLFGGNGPGAYYYIVWRRDGEMLSASSNVPWHGNYQSIWKLSQMSIGAATTLSSTAVRRDDTPVNSGSGILPAGPSIPPDSFRELSEKTPPGEVLLVGHSIAAELAELHHFAWSLTGIGGLVLLLGLTGGWWLATRAMRPIEDISGTAVKIAAGDLSQRINVEDTDNELGRLAGVLNSTFARLEAAFAQQGRFTADAAHELRTPVTVILTQVQTALKHERDAAEYRGTVEACQRAAQRMRGLLESLLELARLDAGQEPMRTRRFDLANTVRDCVELVQPLAAERAIKIQSELPALETAGDPERLAQVFTNLLSNAIHYNRDCGEIRVSVQRQNGSALVTVADTGQGISESDLPHVFERFYRADKSRSSAAGRNGLGLAISQAIVTAHGGTIEVASEFGKGTTFIVHLPAP